MGFSSLWFGKLTRIPSITLRRELWANLPLAVVIAVLGNAFCGFVGRKALHMPDTVLAVLMACNFAGLFLTGPLVGFFDRTPKIAALIRIIFFDSLVLFSISLVPSDKLLEWGGYIFLVQVFLAQVGAALIRTLCSSIWRVNYPAQHRGKIVVLITLVLTFGGSAAIFIFTSAMDYLHISFRVVYFISGFMGLLAVYLYSRVHIRHEKRFLKGMQSRVHRTVPLLAGLSVLRYDRRFRRFMGWQMLNGFSTLTVEGIVLVILVSDVFKSNWLVGGSALAALPLLANGISGLVWARIFDRQDILTMRFVGAQVWAFGRLVLLLGVLLQNVEIFLLSRILSGVAMGLGQLNWRLGHMEFAPPEQDTLYMGAHVSLTGLRGLIGPFVGIYLYNLKCLGPHGVWLIAISALCQSLAGWGFYYMRTHPQKPDVGTTTEIVETSNKNRR